MNTPDIQNTINIIEDSLNRMAIDTLVLRGCVDGGMEIYEDNDNPDFYGLYARHSDDGLTFSIHDFEAGSDFTEIQQGLTLLASNLRVDLDIYSPAGLEVITPSPAGATA